MVRKNLFLRGGAASNRRNLRNMIYGKNLKIIGFFPKVKLVRKKRNNIEEICAFVVYYVYIRGLKKTFDKINCR